MKTQFQKFDKMMEQLLKVPHGESKQKLEAEKASKITRAKKSGKEPKL
jgi:hypothetical protein